VFSKINFIAAFLLVLSLKMHAQASDSTLLYALKENERIVYRDEHRLLMGNNRIAHLLFLQRPSGYFILFDKKEFGPYELIGFTESNSSLYDWAVKSNGQWYQLVLDREKLFGPYESVVDVYRSYELQPLPGAHFGFRGFKNGSWYANIDGKEYGPYRDLDIGTPFFVNNNGTVRAYLKYDYTVTDNVYKYFATGDSVVLGPSNERKSALVKKDNDLYLNDEKVVSDVATLGVAEDASGKNYLAIDAVGQVFLNGKKQENIPAVEVNYNYVSAPFGFIHGTNEFYVRVKTEEGYKYHVSNGRPVPPPSSDPYEMVYFTKNAQHIAYEKSATIYVDGKPVHARGFSLMYDPGKDSFSWLSVKGRSIYLHNFQP